MLSDADSAIQKLGMERAQKGSYLFQSLLASNAQLVLGSDWPVSIIFHKQFVFSLNTYIVQSLAPIVSEGCGSQSHRSFESCNEKNTFWLGQCMDPIRANFII